MDAPDSSSIRPAQLRTLATAIRLRAVGMVARQGMGYLGQALSSAEQFAAIYSVLRPGCDRIVVSPGHYVIAAVAAAVEVGLLDEDVLASYGQDGSAFEAIGSERTPQLDYTCGSLGQGLSAAMGFAVSDRMTGREDRRTFVLLSDGELEEGQVWEAALFGGHHALDRVSVLVDANNSQVDGPVDRITTLQPISAKWREFGWAAFDVDGHDGAAVAAALQQPAEGRPRVVVCQTSTAQGLRCLPPDTDRHFIALPPDLAAAAVAELSEELARGAM